MDASVPTGAALLLNFIYSTETTKPPACYDVIFGNRQTGFAKPLTKMTLGEVVDAQKVWATKAWAKKFGSTAASSAAGAAQFMRATLQGLSKELNLSGSQIFNADFQDRLAFHLLKRRGYQEYMAGKITAIEFGRRLAQEWASLPVLADCQGAHRPVKRGQSFYAGDGLNKSLITPEQVEAVLMKVRKAPDRPPVTVVVIGSGDPALSGSGGGSQKPAESVQPSEPVVVAPKPEVVPAPVPVPPEPWWMKVLKAIWNALRGKK